MRLAAPSPPESHLYHVCARLRFEFREAEGLELCVKLRKSREILGHYQEAHSEIHLTLLLNSLENNMCQTYVMANGENKKIIENGFRLTIMFCYSR